MRLLVHTSSIFPQTVRVWQEWYKVKASLSLHNSGDWKHRCGMLKRPRKRNRKATYIWQHTNMTYMTHVYHMTFWYILTLKTSSSPEEKTCFKWLRTSDSELEIPATRSSKCKCWKNESPSKMTSLPRWSAVSVTHCLHTLRLWLCSLKRLEELRTLDMQSYCRQMPSSWKDQQLQEQQLQLQQQVRDGQGHPNLKYQPVQKALLRLNPCVLKTVRPHNFLLWTRVLHSCILSWPVSNPIQSLRQWIRIMSTYVHRFLEICVEHIHVEDQRLEQDDQQLNEHQQQLEQQECRFWLGMSSKSLSSKQIKRFQEISRGTSTLTCPPSSPQVIPWQF